MDTVNKILRMDECSTLLAVFQAHATHPDTRNRPAVECSAEIWTYDDLDAVSTGIAIDLAARYGARPTVAVVAENLPYTYALELAVWKLGGILAPIDCHTSAALLRPMLAKVKPACVLVPATEPNTGEIVREAGFSLHSFTPESTTMTALLQRFAHISDFDLPPELYPPPNPASTAVYFFTSSASDLSNIKCVPTTHHSLVTAARVLLAWDKRTFPGVEFAHLRVLASGPFSHIWPAFDIGAHVALTAGCYIFGVRPASYHVPSTFAPQIDQNSGTDPAHVLLRTIARSRADVLAGVPWVFDGLMRAAHELPELGAAPLRQLKLLQLGGAPTSKEAIRWAREQGIRLVMSIGMTELCTPLFHRVAANDPDNDPDPGWIIADAIMPDARFTLIDANGEPNEYEGELLISSNHVASGYLDHPSSAFTANADGTITFRTGDRYAKSGGRLKWLGRNDDYILVTSGEIVDPRVLERALDTCDAIARSCIIGDAFLRPGSKALCALIELHPSAAPNDPQTTLAVARALRDVNRALAPPLRIPWGRILLLDPASGEAQRIPVNNKGQVWRKKLETLFASRVASLTRSSPSAPLDAPHHIAPTESNHARAVRPIVISVVAEVLGLTADNLDANSEFTFAELGMDSNAAVVIIRKLNGHFGTRLPPNACHTHLDVPALSTAIAARLENAPSMPPQPTPRTSGLSAAEDVVIVGQALRLPGDVNTSDELWDALVKMRRDLLVPVPSDRWDHSSFRGSGEPGDISFDRAGFVDVAHFDNTFFGISGAEALAVMPAVRLILETAFEALENANIPSSSLKGSNAGIFVAPGMDSGYSDLMFQAMGFASYTRFHGTGVAPSTACGRLSYLLDVHGPSVSIDTACSGGMVAFHQAVQYLQSGEGDTALICAANTHTWPGNFGFLSAQKMVSPNSRCATFASDADGYVPAEGAVSLILKTRRAALRNGDKILAVVKSSATNHNGKSQGLVAPNANAQVTLQRSLLTKAGLRASDIDFVETHGTGTILGDLIEIEAVNTVFASSHTPQQPLILGAAKTCVGHTEVAAGLVGIVKAMKQLSLGKVAGLSSIADGQLNPEIDTNLVPLHVPANAADLRHRNECEAPYRALVVAYGFAGTLAGTVLEAPSPSLETLTSITIPEPPLTWMLFVVSAKSHPALRNYLDRYLDFCADAPDTAFRAICYTSCIGRDLHRHRFACVVRDLAGLRQRLRDRLAQADMHNMATPATGPSTRPRLVLAFPGQGSQFHGMAKSLAERFTGFRAILLDAATVASSVAGFDVLALLLGDDPDANEIDKSAVAQICIFVYQYAVCQFLHILGVNADAVIGNSLGEISAAVEAGALSYEVGLQFVVARARILAPDVKHSAGMVAIAASGDVITKYICDLDLTDRVAIAVFSAPESHVVSGDLEAVKSLLLHSRKMGLLAKQINVDQGFHSHCIDVAIPELEAWVDSYMKPVQRTQVTILSTAHGRKIPPQQILEPRYWVDHARNPVRFFQAAAEIKVDKSLTTACVLDIGPTPTAYAALQLNGLPDNLLLSSAAKQKHDQELAFLSAVASLTEYGINPDFLALFGKGTPTTNIPTYPFLRQRHYPNFIPRRCSRESPCLTEATATSKSLLVDEGMFVLLDDHRINHDVVLPGAAMVIFFAESKPKHNLDIRFRRPLVVESAGQACDAMISVGGAFSLLDGDKGDELCSGTFSPAAFTPRNILPVSTDGSSKALYDGDAVYHSFVNVPDGSSKALYDGNAVYHSFVNVQFGPLFRNIQSVHEWDSYVDGLITVKPSSSPQHDRIRALDACLHMFGVCHRPDDQSFASGAFLPMALKGFAMHVDALPASFICRYHLPIKLKRNGHVASTAFEVIAHTGELLASCAQYSVGWVEMDIAPPATLSYQLEWVPRERGVKLDAEKRIIVFGRRGDWITGLLSNAGHGSLVPCTPDVRCRFRNESGWQCIPLEDTKYVFDTIDLGADSTVILDATATDVPASPSFAVFWQTMLRVMKALGQQKNRTFSLVVVSIALSPAAASPSLAGAIIHGMLRVYCQETGLENAFGIELPAEVSSADMAKLVRAEIEALRGTPKDNVVSYASSHDSGQITRLVPELRPLPVRIGGTATRLSGVAVIVGMGSIGLPLGAQMLTAGSSVVVFIGRRPQTDNSVAQQLSSLFKASDRVAYIQADVCDLDSLRRALQEIAERYGAIKHILHTAAVISDATIAGVTADAFERVLRPKVHGAYNLHVLSVELGLNLDTFALFSSISVSLGNFGQVAYVAANSALEALATQRRSLGLPGIALQLGAWESALMDQLGTRGVGASVVGTITHAEGLPLILRVLANCKPELLEPVQVIAALDKTELARTAGLADDALFAALLAGTVADSRRTSAVNSPDGVVRVVAEALRGVLELGESEPLELNEPLTACGIDSIAFGQLRGAITKQLGVNVPLMYLSDAFTVNDMIANIQESVFKETA